MIHEVAGDLLLSRAGMVAHGIAPHDDCKHGLALALRTNHPAMYKDFRHWCKTESPKPGAVWLWRGTGRDGGPVAIASLLTQEAPAYEGAHAGKAHTEFVNRALHALRKLVEQEQPRSLAISRLATGVGGLDWKLVAPLLKVQLGSLQLPIYVYSRFLSGVAAPEPGAPNPGP